MNTHRIGTREEWVAARVKLLDAEKELTKRGDELALQRQQLPWVRVEKQYEFDTDKGRESLADLFRGRSQLMIYHFMFGSDYKAGCPTCSSIADGFNGSVVHLAHHDVMFWAISRAPLEKLLAYEYRMQWSFPWASSVHTDITSPTATVTSMNGVIIHAERGLEFAAEADAVIVGSGIMTREIVKDAELLARLNLDPTRQLIGAQCSGTLLLAKMGLLGDCPACTDLTTKPWVIEAGVRVLDQPFFADGNVATAGGCLASQYLAAWILLRAASREDCEAALHYVAPVGQKSEYVQWAIESVVPHLKGTQAATQVLEECTA